MADFDVFISHSSADKVAVRDIARRLKATGTSVWLDEEQLVAGQPWQQAIEEALQSVRSVIVFIGASGLGPWAESEVAYGIRRGIENPDFRLIPVLGPGASAEDIPLFLKTRTYVDLRDLDDEDQFYLLVTALRGKSPGPSKGGGYSPKVFLCHAKEDADRVEALYYKLQDEGLDPWYDKKNLVIGDDWEDEILKAIEKTDFFTICLSPLSVEKRGFVQKEIKTAVREYQNRPHGWAYLLPIRLKECEVPRIKLDSNKVLPDLHWIDIFEGDVDAIVEFAQGIWTQWNRRNED